jgi:hypothetical protein
MAGSARTCHAFSLQKRLLRLKTTDEKPAIKLVDRMLLTTCETVAWGGG